MVIAPNELELEETDASHGLQTTVLYFTLPGEPFAGLVRKVTVRNIASQPVEIELLDGLPAIIPFGVTNFLLKELGRTVEAWMAVTNLEQRLPFYRVRASIVDRPEVETFEAGHFYLAFAVGAGLAPAPLAPAPQGDRKGAPLLFVDPTVVFGANTALSHPDRFLTGSLAEMAAAPQVPVCRTPCGFAGAAAAPGAGREPDALRDHRPRGPGGYHQSGTAAAGRPRLHRRETHRSARRWRPR